MNAATRNGYCDLSGAPVALHKHVPVRRRLIDGLLAVTSLGVLWLIILMIDGNAGMHVARFFKTSASTNGGVAMQVSDNVSHVTRSVWELSYVYGPLMTFTVVGLVLVIVLTRSSKY